MNIYQNNILCINKYNPVLATRLEEHILNKNVNYEVVTTESGDYNLICNGMPVHDLKDPQQEAQLIFNKLKNTSENSIALILGLGLGYLFKRLYLSSKGKIIIYEPNMDILHFTLEIVDFSQELGEIKDGKPRVYITNTRTELMKFLEEAYTYKANLNICGLNSAKELYPEELNTLQSNLTEICANLESNYATLFQKAFYWSMNGLRNIPQLINSYNIDSLKNVFRDKPAVIVSSGPSLDKNIECLSKYRDKVIVFCVGNAYRALVKHNIKPDFLAFIDAEIVTSQVEGLDTSDLNLILQSVANMAFFDLKNKRKFIFYSNNDLFSRWISNIADFDISEYHNKGTVSYLSLCSAFMLGCNPIILTGQDLAYTDNKCYSSDSAYGTLKFIRDGKTGKYRVEPENKEEFAKYYLTSAYNTQEKVDSAIEYKLNLLNTGLVTVPGQDGNSLLTHIHYAGFIQFFEQFAYEYSFSNPYLRLINSSTGGAQLDGFENKKLDDVLKDLPVLDIDVDSVIDDKLAGYKDPVKAHADDIIKEVESVIKEINTLISLSQRGIDTANQLLVELEMPNLNLNRIKMLSGRLIEYYVKFRESFNAHQILTDSVFKELLELTDIMETENSGGIGYLVDIARLSKEFYVMFSKRMEAFKDRVEPVLIDQLLNVHQPLNLQ